MHNVHSFLRGREYMARMQYVKNRRVRYLRVLALIMSLIQWTGLQFVLNANQQVGLNYLKLSSRLDAVASRIETAITTKVVSVCCVLLCCVLSGWIPVHPPPPKNKKWWFRIGSRGIVDLSKAASAGNKGRTSMHVIGRQTHP